MDIVYIRGLMIETTIGIHDWEKKIRRPVILDIEMASDIARAAATDRIEEALDYNAVTKRLTQEVSANRFELVETLAERCAAILRDEHGVPWVRLSLNKPGAVGEGVDVGVVIERGTKPD
ncbi:dihydroneopterin aldolase [Thiorhodococcus minor]|uniref:Dihydroneopterin aldolase n=1 Tax=Thiorhodococcus minor TaxID=57489 RepID=A0A6M0JYD7_9GAMM|nr:dihydroneopterin aldolase [Thiorhodococcus minor]NEV61367.1 dihydroneopterin aldolase [Thiorhodococcus minor]